MSPVANPSKTALSLAKSCTHRARAGAWNAQDEAIQPVLGSTSDLDILQVEAVETALASTRAVSPTEFISAAHGYARSRKRGSLRHTTLGDSSQVRHRRTLSFHTRAQKQAP